MQKNKFSTDRVVPSGGAQSKNKLSIDRIIAMICISVGTLALMVTAVMTGLLLRDKDIPSHAVINSGHVDGSFPVIAAGSLFSLAITANGDLYSWGENHSGQLGLGDYGFGTERKTPQYVSAGSRKYKAVAAGGLAFAIAQNGDLYSWGHSDSTRLGRSASNFDTPGHVSTGSLKYQAIEVGDSHALAIAENGDLYVWGQNYYGQLGLGDTNSRSVPTHANAGSRKYKAIAASGDFSVAIATNGDLYVWGHDADSNPGIGNPSAPSYTMHLVSGNKYKAIAAGGGGGGYADGRVLAIAENGDLYAWGHNGNRFELGLGSLSNWYYNAPQKVMNGSFKAIAASSYHSFALMQNGDLYSWGFNYSGQLGLGIDGSGAERHSPQHVNSGARKYKTVTSGYSHNLAISEDGGLYSWGANGSGQLGLNDTNLRNIPTLVSGLTFQVGGPYNITATITTPAADGGVRVLGQPVAIAAGGNHTLAIDSDGKLFSWGENFRGQLGRDVGATNTPQIVTATANYQFKAIAAGNNHSLAILENGDLYAWGDNIYGQIGQGDGLMYPTFGSPHHVNPGWTDRKYKAIAAGKDYSLAIAENGDLYAWGRNHVGQLGLGNVTNYDTPQHVGSGSRKYKAISAGNVHTLAIAENGDLYAWGDDGQDNRLGVGDHWSIQSTPLHVNSGSLKYKSIAAGDNHSLAIAENGDLYSWGGNWNGQLGLGFFSSCVSFPYHVNNGSRKYKEISAGYNFSLAIAENGDLYTWGLDWYGQLGRGYDEANICTPHLITYASGIPNGTCKFKAIAAGNQHTIAIAENNNSVYACGLDANGALGVGGTWTCLFLTRVPGL